MFSFILQQYINGFGTTLNMFWIAMDVSFQIVSSKFIFMFEKVALHSKLSQHLKQGSLF